MEASPGAHPAVLPIPGGRSSSVRRPARLLLEPRPLKLPRPAAGRITKSWPNQKYDFRTKAKARMALKDSSVLAPPCGAQCVVGAGAERVALSL